MDLTPLNTKYSVFSVLDRTISRVTKFRRKFKAIYRYKILPTLARHGFETKTAEDQFGGRPPDGRRRRPRDGACPA